MKTMNVPRGSARAARRASGNFQPMAAPAAKLSTSQFYRLLSIGIISKI